MFDTLKAIGVGLYEASLGDDPSGSRADEIPRLKNEIARLRAALAPILTHAAAPDTAPPLRISVSMAREIKEKIGLGQIKPEGKEEES